MSGHPGIEQGRMVVRDNRMAKPKYLDNSAMKISKCNRRPIRKIGLEVRDSFISFGKFDPSRPLVSCDETILAGMHRLIISVLLDCPVFGYERNGVGSNIEEVDLIRAAQDTEVRPSEWTLLSEVGIFADHVKRRAAMQLECMKVGSGRVRADKVNDKFKSFLGKDTRVRETKDGDLLPLSGEVARRHFIFRARGKSDRERLIGGCEVLSSMKLFEYLLIMEANGEIKWTEHHVKRANRLTVSTANAMVSQAIECGFLKNDYVPFPAINAKADSVSSPHPSSVTNRTIGNIRNKKLSKVTTEEFKDLVREIKAFSTLFLPDRYPEAIADEAQGLIAKFNRLVQNGTK